LKLSLEIRAYKFNRIVNCRSNTENLNGVLALVIGLFFLWLCSTNLKYVTVYIQKPNCHTSEKEENFAFVYHHICNSYRVHITWVARREDIDQPARFQMQTRVEGTVKHSTLYPVLGTNHDLIWCQNEWMILIWKPMSLGRFQNSNQ